MLSGLITKTTNIWLFSVYSGVVAKGAIVTIVPRHKFWLIEKIISKLPNLGTIGLNFGKFKLFSIIFGKKLQHFVPYLFNLQRRFLLTSNRQFKAKLSCLQNLLF